MHAENCPFCGRTPNLEDPDTLYPNGIFWRYREDLGLRTYHSRKDRQESDGVCYTMHCVAHAGGCGAEITGDSLQEALELWNSRAPLKDKKALLKALRPAIAAIYFDDGSDFESALWETIRNLDPALAEALEKDPAATWAGSQ